MNKISLIQDLQEDLQKDVLFLSKRIWACPFLQPKETPTKETGGGRIAWEEQGVNMTYAIKSSKSCFYLKFHKIRACEEDQHATPGRTSWIQQVAKLE